MFQLVNCNDDENDIQVDQIAGIIKKEIMKLPKLKEEYPQLDEVSMWQSCSETLLLLLSKVPPSLYKTLCAGLIGNIITTAITSHHFMLQIALELYARKKKSSNCMPLVYLLPTMNLDVQDFGSRYHKFFRKRTK